MCEKIPCTTALQIDLDLFGHALYVNVAKQYFVLHPSRNPRLGYAVKVLKTMVAIERNCRRNLKECHLVDVKVRDEFIAVSESWLQSNKIVSASLSIFSCLNLYDLRTNS